jgi:hypothetical protein
MDLARQRAVPAEKERTMTASRSHDETVVELLKADPEFADVYLAVALNEADQPGGQSALLAALRQIAEAQGQISEPFKATIEATPREPVDDEPPARLLLRQSPRPTRPNACRNS